MSSYCPYSNIRQGEVYPNMLVVAGMNDPRVAYFEPAKWVAKLRANAIWRSTTSAPTSNGDLLSSSDPHPPSIDQTQSDRILLLKIQDVGHSGSSGQYSYLEDLAFEYAYLISMLGAAFRPVGCGGKDVSLSGVDYDIYWDELAEEQGADEEYFEEELEEEVPIKPSTPLQRFFSGLRRGSEKRDRKKKERSSSQDLTTENAADTESRSRRVSSKRHSRSGSLLGLIRTKSKNAEIPASNIPEEDAAPEIAALTIQQENTTENSLDNAPMPRTDNVENKLPFKPLGPRRSPSVTPSGSKASLRHQLYPPDDESGRVQSSKRVYGFLSKFFTEK